MPQIYFTVSSEAATSSDNQKWLKDDTTSTIKENIRERLNLHVKRRIQDQDLSPVNQSYTSTSAPLSLLSTTPSLTIHPSNPLFAFNHPREYIPGNPSIPPALIISSEFNKHSNDLHSNVRLMNIAAEQNSSKSKQKSPKRLNGRKKTMNNKHLKAIDAQQNHLLDARYSNVSTDSNDKPIGLANNDEEYARNCYEKFDTKLTNSPDILSMILSIKKNALMHDPEVIQFILSLR